MSNIPTIFVSGLGLGSSDEDKMVILTLIDAISNDEMVKYRFALPPSIVAQLSSGLNKACEELKIDNNFDKDTD